jgi:hypothetical protein
LRRVKEADADCRGSENMKKQLTQTAYKKKIREIVADIIVLITTLEQQPGLKVDRG